MTFDEVDLSDGPHRTSSYTVLTDYCTSDYWREEAERFTCKRKSFELESGLEKEARHQEMLSDSWIPEVTQCTVEEELQDLEDAYRTMSKMTAEYLMVEIAAAKYSKHSQPMLHRGPLPTLLPGGARKQHSQAVCESKEQYTPKPNYLATVFKESTLMCREWLLEHYEGREGVSIPRSAMYSHYLDFCTEKSLEPLNPAGFGKAVRSIFLHVQTRRLGNRGASKYHYNGLSIKDSSPYRSILESTQRVNHLNDYDMPSTPNFHARTVKLSEDGSKIMLEGFPSVLSIPVPLALKDKLHQFLAEYRSHAECVLELVVHTSFTEIKDELLRFWTSLPERLQTILSHICVVNVIHLCDMAMYKSLAGLLIPSINENLPSNLLSAVRDLTENLVVWTQEAMATLPLPLQTVKSTAVKEFKQQMWRQSVLCHLVQGVKATLRDQELMKQMLSDWLTLDLALVVTEILERIGEDGSPHAQASYHLRKSMRDIERLLSHHAPLDKFFMLVNNVLHNCSAVYIEEENTTLDIAVAKVVLNWNTAVSVLLKELTNKETSTFGSFHLLGMLLTDYMMYLIEDRRRALKEVKVKDQVYTDTKAFLKTSVDLALTDFTPIAPKWSGEALSVPSTSNHSSRAIKTGFLAAVPIAVDSITDTELSGILSRLSAEEELMPGYSGYHQNIPNTTKSVLMNNNKTLKIMRNKQSVVQNIANIEKTRTFSVLRSSGQLDKKSRTILPQTSQNQFKPVTTSGGVPAQTYKTVEIKKEMSSEVLVLDSNVRVMGMSGGNGVQIKDRSQQNKQIVNNSCLKSNSNDIVMVDIAQAEPTLKKVKDLSVLDTDISEASNLSSGESYAGHGFNAFKEEILQETDTAVQKISQVCVEEDLVDAAIVDNEEMYGGCEGNIAGSYTMEYTVYSEN